MSIRYGIQGTALLGLLLAAAGVFAAAAGDGGSQKKATSLEATTPSLQKAPSVNPTTPSIPLSPSTLRQTTVSTKVVIMSVSPETCVADTAAISVNGRGFTQAGVAELYLIDGATAIAVKETGRSASSIQALLPGPSQLSPGRSYRLGLRSNSGTWASNTDKQISICPLKSTQSVFTRAVAVDRPPSEPPPAPNNDVPSPNQPAPPASTGFATPPPASGGSLLTGGLPPPPKDLPPVTKKDDDSVEPGEILVVSASMAEAQTLSQQAQNLGLGVRRRSNLNGLGLVVTVLRAPSGQSAGEALGVLRRALPEVWADNNHRFGLQGEAVEEYGSRMIGWHLGGTSSCGHGARIGLLDTAVDISHPALSGRGVTTRSLLPAGVESAPSAHGTATAALLVGFDPASKIAGLTPSAHLYSANIFRQRKKQVETTAEWISLGLDWLASQGVQIVNLSLGGPRNLLVEAVVNRLLQRGVAVVAAAGNGGSAAPPAYPAAQPGVVAVTAIDADLQVYRDANRGDYIRFAAPGVDVWTAAPGRGGVFVSGTSYATPFVTASLAAARQAKTQASWTSVIEQLQAGARDLGAPGRDPVYGYGLLQASAPCLTAQSPAAAQR